MSARDVAGRKLRGDIMKILAWSIITSFVALTIFIIVSGLTSSNPWTNLLSTVLTCLLGVTIAILLIVWAIYEVLK